MEMSGLLNEMSKFKGYLVFSVSNVPNVACDKSRNNLWTIFPFCANLS